jgi:phenylalanyl-tRNA synthetase beta chain
VSALLAAIPEQRRHVAAVLCGEFDPGGWWGPGRAADWADAIEAARVVAGSAGTEVDVHPAQTPPWHPGRCAEVRVGGVDGAVIGHAGELHPRVVSAFGLPERSCAMELDIDALDVPGPALAPRLWNYPPVLLDVALVVPEPVAAVDLMAALRDGAGELLESVRLFDVYRDEARLGTGHKSLAFSLRFRAPDRTLTVEEAGIARDAAITSTAVLGARLRD